MAKDNEDKTGAAAASDPAAQETAVPETSEAVDALRAQLDALAGQNAALAAQNAAILAKLESLPPAQAPDGIPATIDTTKLTGPRVDTSKISAHEEHRQIVDIIARNGSWMSPEGVIHTTIATVPRPEQLVKPGTPEAKQTAEQLRAEANDKLAAARALDEAPEA